MLLLVQQCLLLWAGHGARWASGNQLTICSQELVVTLSKVLLLLYLSKPNVTNQINPLKQLVRVNLVDKALGVMEGVIIEKVVFSAVMASN